MLQKESVLVHQDQQTVQKFFQVGLATGAVALDVGHFGPDLLKGEQAGGVASEEFVVVILQTQAGDVAEAMLHRAAARCSRVLGVLESREHRALTPT